MAISVISISLDSSEESVRTSTGRVILFGTIPTTITDTTPSVIPPSTHIDTALTPTSPDYTPASPDYLPASDAEFDPSEDPSSDHIPLLPATSPFLSSTNDSSDSDIPDTPPSPTHGTPLLGLPFLLRDHFSLDDSLRDSSSSSSLETSLNPSSDDLPNSLTDHSLPAPSSGMRLNHHLCSLVPSVPCLSTTITDRPSHSSSSASPSCKRSRSPAASVPLSSLIPGALSSACADILPSPKRIRSLESAMDLKGCSEDSFEPYVPREAGLGVDVEDESFEPSRSRETDVRARGIDARVAVEAVDRDKVETGSRGPVEIRVDRVTHPVIADDIPEPSQEGVVEAIESIQRDQGHRIIATRQQSADILDRIRELERDNRRPRDMMDVESQRVTPFRHRELRVQRNLGQTRRFRIYDRMRIARLEACVRRHLGYLS
nr:hypothetical protein [Tanacetum cinerariifolium]